GEPLHGLLHLNGEILLFDELGVLFGELGSGLAEVGCLLFGIFDTGSGAVYFIPVRLFVGDALGFTSLLCLLLAFLLPLLLQLRELSFKLGHAINLWLGGWLGFSGNRLLGGRLG